MTTRAGAGSWSSGPRRWDRASSTSSPTTTPNLPESFSWVLDSGEKLRQLDGTYRFEPEDDGTRVHYDLVVDLSIPLPGIIKRRAAGMIMGTALRELKKAVEAKRSSLDRMRDPGPPRRNPFFEHGSEGAVDDPGMGWRDPDDGAGAPRGRRRSDPTAVATGGFAAIFALAEALGDAQPEAAEHLVAAAHEVVLTVKVLVDATEAVLAEQRAAMAARQRAAERARRRRCRAATDAAVTDLAAIRRAEGP